MRLSRNFGQHRAITAGLDARRGEWIVMMDCDLQGRPEDIPDLLACAQQTPADIVLARRVERQDSFLKRLFSRTFYQVLSYLTGTQQDPAIANFGIYRRKVIEAVLAMRESIRYFPTMVRWVGFCTATLAVTHAERATGTSSYNVSRLINLALDIILAYSDKPLCLTVKAGLLVSASAFLMGLFMLWRFVQGEIVALGYTSLIVSVWFSSGLLLSVLGIVGFYLGKTFEQVKARPLYLLDEPVLVQARRAVHYPIKIGQAIELVAGCYTELRAVSGSMYRPPKSSRLRWSAVERFHLDTDPETALLRSSGRGCRPATRCQLRLRTTAKPPTASGATNTTTGSTALSTGRGGCAPLTRDALGWPYCGASTLVEGELLRVVAAEKAPELIVENRTPGKVLFVNARSPVVVCGQGLLQITDLRRADGESALPLPKYRVRFN